MKMQHGGSSVVEESTEAIDLELSCRRQTVEDECLQSQIEGDIIINDFDNCIGSFDQSTNLLCRSTLQQDGLSDIPSCSQQSVR